MEIQPATSITCQRMLEEGHVLAISPGGVREALFSDHHYQLIWKERKGFARVAIAAKTVRRFVVFSSQLESFRFV